MHMRKLGIWLCRVFQEHFELSSLATVKKYYSLPSNNSALLLLPLSAALTLTLTQKHFEARKNEYNYAYI